MDWILRYYKSVPLHHFYTNVDQCFMNAIYVHQIKVVRFLLQHLTLGQAD